MQAMGIDGQVDESGGADVARNGRAPRKSLRERAYEAIKQQIITCELRPGEVLSEAAVSAALGIGRTPVHQALDRLIVQAGIDDAAVRQAVCGHDLHAANSALTSS